MTNDTRSQKPGTDAADGKGIEEKLVAFAERLGTLIGTVQSKAEGWLDRGKLAKEIRHIRDEANDLLAQVSSTAALKPKAQTTPAQTEPRRSRGPVDAPGKRHRKPVPQERIDKRMGDRIGKQMGQKTAKNARRGGRG